MPPVAKKTKKTHKNVTPSPNGKSAEGPVEKLVISGQLEKKMRKSQARIDNERGIVLIKHLPHGFFEDQLKNYFQQFGKVTRLRLARSKRTGGSKGFAFVEFEYPEVAKVAAETMDNYLMFQRVVKAAYIPPENRMYNYFKTSVRKVTNKVGKPIYVSSRTIGIQRRTNEHNNWTPEAYQKRIGSSLRKINKLKAKYAHLGIDFDKFTVQPNIQTADAKEDEKILKEAEQKPSKDIKPAPGSLLLIKKRKQTPENIQIESKKTKTEKTIGLKDLLEKTLDDEDSSDDEEFIPMPEDEDATTSEDDTCDIIKDLDHNKLIMNNTDDEDESQEEGKPVKPKKRETSSKVNRFEGLMQRKPNIGGIQKPNKKSLKDKIKGSKPNSAMNTLRLAAAREIKQKGKMKQLKKSDLKKPNRKQKV